MKIITAFTLAVVFGLLVSCAATPRAMDMEMTQAIQSAKTRSDHEALAKHYEDAAKDQQLKADEHKKLLATYDSNSLISPDRLANIKRQHEALIRAYEQAAAADMNIAKVHHEMAAATN